MKTYWFLITLQWNDKKGKQHTRSYADQIDLPDASSWGRFDAIFEKAMDVMGINRAYEPALLFYTWEEVPNGHASATAL